MKHHHQMLLSSFITAAFILSSCDAKILKAAASPITLQDVLDSKYSATGYGGSWLSDAELEYRSDGNIYTHNIHTDEHTMSLNGSIFGTYQGRSISFSPDRRFVLITYGVEPLWRYSTRAYYVIYDIGLGTYENIQTNNSGDQQKLSLFRWATSGNAFVFVYRNNMYYRTSASQATNPVYVQLTSDPEDGPISNGHTDWVYEEEMFGSPNALWFSKDASNLAFVKFDDEDVEKFQYPIYGEPGNRETAYPTWIEIFYPKPGSNNPKVQLNLVRLGVQNPTPTRFTYNPPQDPQENRHYIATVTWLTGSKLLVVHLNRHQTHSTYYVCDVTVNLAICTQRFEEIVENGWIDVYTPRVSSNGETMVTILPREVSPGVNYKQIVKVNINDGQPVVAAQVTKELISVNSILAWDEVNNRIYFSGTGLIYDTESLPVPSPSQTQIYGITIQATPPRPTCITCNFVNKDESLCKSNSASFNGALTYFLHTCSGPGIPEVQVKENNAEYTAHLMLQQNEPLRILLADVPLPGVMDYSIAIPDSEFTINVRLLVPPDFDAEAGTKYPLLIDVYGGPSSQQIGEGYSVHWGTSLVTDRNVIYGYIDGRGSGGQSMELLHQLYRQLGTVEIEDQIFATKWLVENVDFIDGNQTGIWGWSYGGYATAMALATDTQNVFKCGIAVAPVTSWLYYDTIYTERFMGLPTDSDNWVGYSAGQVTNRAINFRNKEFLLVHGNADDNVHYQQSMILARALQKADISFDQISYPDENHSILGVRNHLYHSLERFLFRSCFTELKKSGSPSQGSLGHLTIIASLTIILCGLVTF